MWVDGENFKIEEGYARVAYMSLTQNISMNLWKHKNK
ncbi:hypothetical protein MM221_20295 [Salipaludibacillus sp. LMS25]|nr:hypothetical protein [Salipaludibacillus sp. LMS25]UTR17099.1 hypothetical protein MM221_20295 [Salipaludibacillus sp. LMS25]